MTDYTQQHLSRETWELTVRAIEDALEPPQRARAIRRVWRRHAKVGVFDTKTWHFSKTARENVERQRRLFGWHGGVK